MSRRGWVLFSAMCVIWGIPYLLIKIAIDEVEPSVLVLVRCAIAGLVLLPVAAATGKLRGLRAVWPVLALYTLVEICGPFLLMGYAEKRLTSSMTGLLIAGVPLVGAVIARWSGDRERLGWRRLVGLGFGVAGVAALVGLDLGVAEWPALAAIGGVVLGYAIGPVILARRLSDQPPLGVAAVSVTLAALFYLPVGIVQAPSSMPSRDTLLSLAALGLICTAAAFLIFFRLIAEVGPARATVITYVNPAVAVLLGVVLLSEPFTWATGLGFVLVLAGSVLATWRSVAAPEPAADRLDTAAAVGATPAPKP